MYELLLAIHLLAAAVWVGGGIAMTVITMRMNIAERRTIAPHLDFYGGKVITGSAVVLLLAGIGLVSEMASVEIGDLWVILGLAGWLISAIVGGAFFGPMGKKIAAAASDEEAEALFARLLTVSRLDSLLVALVVIDMAVKPGG
jgi:hypothetical protein